MSVGSGKQLTWAGFSQRRSTCCACGTIRGVRVERDSGGHIAAQPRVVTYNAAHAHSAYRESAPSKKSQSHHTVFCNWDVPSPTSFMPHESRMRCPRNWIRPKGRDKRVGTCNVTLKVCSKFRWDCRALFFKTLGTASELSNRNSPAPPKSLNQTLV